VLLGGRNAVIKTVGHCGIATMPAVKTFSHNEEQQPHCKICKQLWPTSVRNYLLQPAESQAIIAPVDSLFIYHLLNFAAAHSVKLQCFVSDLL